MDKMRYKLPANIRILRDYYVVYTHSLASAGVFYVGCCSFNELLKFPDAVKNSEWRKITQHEHTIDIEVLAMTVKPEDATTLQTFHATLLHAHCNKVGRVSVGRSAAIMCENDGQEWFSIAEAARSYGIPATSISSHLAGRPGYGHVKNYRFKRL